MELEDDEKAAEWYVELDYGLRKMTVWEHQLLEKSWARDITEISYDWPVKMWWVVKDDEWTPNYVIWHYKINLLDMTQTNDSTCRPAIAWVDF
jgi:hypothetical protein